MVTINKGKKRRPHKYKHEFANHNGLIQSRTAFKNMQIQRHYCFLAPTCLVLSGKRQLKLWHEEQKPGRCHTTTQSLHDSAWPAAFVWTAVEWYYTVSIDITTGWNMIQLLEMVGIN